MMKKIFPIILLAAIVLISGCTNRFYLDQQYYNQDGKFINLSSSDFEDFDTQNYVLFVYNNYCAFSVPCDQIFEQFMKGKNINFLSMSFEEFKKISLHDIVEFAPSVIIVKNWKIVNYLNAEKDSDVQKYQDVDSFWNWISRYVYLEIGNN